MLRYSYFCFPQTVFLCNSKERELNIMSAIWAAPLAFGCIPSACTRPPYFENSVWRSIILHFFFLATLLIIGMIPFTITESLIFHVPLKAGIGVARYNCGFAESDFNVSTIASKSF